MELAEILASLADRAEVTIVAETEPKLLKKSRTTKNPCPFKSVTKVGCYCLNLADDYVRPETDGNAQTETKERKPWYESTEHKFIKRSLDGKKHYVSAHCLSVQSHFIVDGEVANEELVKVLREEYLPKPSASNGMAWVMVGTDNIKSVF